MNKKIQQNLPRNRQDKHHQNEIYEKNKKLTHTDPFESENCSPVESDASETFKLLQIVQST